VTEVAKRWGYLTPTRKKWFGVVAPFARAPAKKF